MAGGNKGQDTKTPVLFWALPGLPVGYLAAVLADVWQQGVVLADFFAQLQSKLFAPWLVRWTDKTPAFVLGFLLLYALAVFCFQSESANRRPGEEHGSAKWGKAKTLNIKYAHPKEPFDNIILTQNIAIGYDTRRHRRNLNVLVVSSSGAGKTRFYCNTDEILVLGTSEVNSAEQFSKMLGKATINTKTHGITKGRSGSSSENYQTAGRELMTPDEIRLMDNRYALLFIRGENPVMDLKYDILKHPNIHLTADGGAEAFYIRRHGESYARTALSFTASDIDDVEVVA